MKNKLTEEQYNICFLKGTEPPFSGRYNSEIRDGVYKCVNCDTPLFYSSRKFESGTGWPSFDNPVEKKNIKYEDDFSMGMHRVEVLCAKCGAHLGHVFQDGPKEPFGSAQGKLTGQRYCINSLALEFVPN